MLRKIEKGLNTQKNSKTSHQRDEPSDRLSPGECSADDGFTRAGSTSLFASNHLPPLPIQSGQASRSSMDVDDQDENDRSPDVTLPPAKMIHKENSRNSFFSTILNPDHKPLPPVCTDFSRSRMIRMDSGSKPVSPSASQYQDPVEAGILELDQAYQLIEFIFLRLNPFINLFDPVLHTPTYIRERSPFLFTVLLMAGCKFFKPELYQPCKKLANEMCVQAFAEGWKSIEVVQAFACMTYWKEPNDNRTWTYIGYACRMAIELGLNRYFPEPPPGETEVQLRERRNRERTYLVLFVHDRSLSTQTGRNWMLPVCDLVSHAATWHEAGPAPVRPEDVIVASFVLLRTIAADATEWFSVNQTVPGGASSHTDTQFDMTLRTTNQKLAKWSEHWTQEMRRANGHSFHIAFISLFKNYVKLFLNSFGIHMSSTPVRLHERLAHHLI
jgi:hypothetical protein